MYGLRYRPTQPNVSRVTQPDHPEHVSSAEAVFGAMVRTRRGHLALTQEQLRKRLLDSYGIDLSKTAMSRLEQGERPIRLNEVQALANLLTIDMSGFGRAANPEHGGDEFVARAIKKSEERLSAVRKELDAVQSQLEMLNAARQEAQLRYDRLREQVRGLNDLQGVLMSHQITEEHARRLAKQWLEEN